MGLPVWFVAMCVSYPLALCSWSQYLLRSVKPGNLAKYGVKPSMLKFQNLTAAVRRAAIYWAAPMYGCFTSRLILLQTLWGKWCFPSGSRWHSASGRYTCQGHTTVKWQCLTLNPRRFIYKPSLFPFLILFPSLPTSCYGTGKVHHLAEKFGVPSLVHWNTTWILKKRTSSFTLFYSFSKIILEI